MTLDTQMTLALLQELVMALRANDADGCKGWLAHGRPRLRERVMSFYSGLMELIFLSLICRFYGNTLRTLRTLRTLLNAYNPRKVLFTLILFLENVRRVKGGGRECFYKAR